MRLAFLGQATFFEACALQGGRDGIDARFFEHRKDAAGVGLEALRDFDPDVAVVFRPEIVPPGALHGLRGRTLGFLTEPLPRTEDGAPRHEDLERRLWELEQVDTANFDRVVSFDPHIARTADRVLPVWRSVPLPVNDRYFAAVHDGTPRPQALFVGRSTPHREQLLTPAKHHFDVLHLAFGVDADRLEGVMREHDIAINLHNNPYPSFENRVCLHLAAGQLVLSEPLHPAHGLEAGIDHVEFSTAGELARALDGLRRDPRLFRRVRLRGRRKAELFRASRVWPRLARDLLVDVAAFGSRRPA